IFGVLLATVTGNLGTFTDFGTISLVFPKFNFEAFTLIGVRSFLEGPCGSLNLIFSGSFQIDLSLIVVSFVRF
ncbi:MAG: hypothetical protein J6A23_13895, partial [Thermoguttaceae bacterium]|nr:hypothetical protein [Thermoguttaceae bacterium]